LQGREHVIGIDAVSARHVGNALFLDQMTEAGPSSHDSVDDFVEHGL
jgi:hypothetical protein